jgi:hypothetical protein
MPSKVLVVYIYSVGDSSKTAILFIDEDFEGENIMDAKFFGEPSCKRKPWAAKKSNMILYADFEASSIFVLELLMCYCSFVGFWEPIYIKGLIRCLI